MAKTIEINFGYTKQVLSFDFEKASTKVLLEDGDSEEEELDKARERLLRWHKKNNPHLDIASVTITTETKQQKGEHYVPLEKRIPDAIVKQKMKIAIANNDEKTINELKEHYIFS